MDFMLAVATWLARIWRPSCRFIPTAVGARRPIAVYGDDIKRNLHLSPSDGSGVGVLTIGFDVAKEFDSSLSAAIPDTPAIERVKALEAECGPAIVGIDVLGAIARLLEVILLETGLGVVHMRGRVKVGPRATRGGEQTSHPGDSRVAADQVRAEDGLGVITAASDADVATALLVGRR